MARKTNVQAVKSMMEYSNHGALAQVFIMTAIQKYAETVLKATPEQLASLEKSFINPDVWQSVAKEVKQKLDDHFNS